MSSPLYHALISEIRELEIANIIKFDPECKSEIEKWNIGLGFKRALQWHWFGSEVCVGPTLYGVEQIIAREKETRSLTTPFCFLCIGSGPNGDDLLVDAKKFGVYFWNHETARMRNTRAKSDCAKLYDHVISLLLHVRNRDYIPWDSFQAHDDYEIFKGV